MEKHSTYKIKQIILSKKNKKQKNDQAPCWKNYEQIGMKEKDGKMVPNCVPKKNKKASKEDNTYHNSPYWTIWTEQDGKVIAFRCSDGRSGREPFNLEGFERLMKLIGKNEYEKIGFTHNKIVEAAEYKGRKVNLNKPFRTPNGPKKFSVYVKNDKGNVVKVNFGDPNMEIKRDDPKRRKSFRARHKCDNPGPKWKARYWSCWQWRPNAKVQG